MRLTWTGLLSILLFALLAPNARAGGPPAHAPISILSDADFRNCACVTGGAGSKADPFIIGPWTINKVNSGAAVFVDGSSLTTSFVIPNLTAAGNSRAGTQGIVLENINKSGVENIVVRVTGTQTSIQSLDVGMRVLSSSFVTLDGGGANPKGPGIGQSGAGTINKNLSGAIDIEGSSHITVQGWQMSANGGDHQPDWVTLDPSSWGIGGVFLLGVMNSTIDHNAVNNCTDNSFSVFNSSGNTVSNNTADYPFTMNFIVADGSVNNTLIGNVASTGDFVGYMVADPLPGTATLALYGPTHDNLVTGNISHTDGPTGNEIGGGVVPAFLGGFVVLNGTYNNTISNNQDWASTGTGFVWAQAVADPTTAIGVKVYPPILHCNVTAYDGPLPAPALNGNVWFGNIFQTIDPCLPPQ